MPLAVWLVYGAVAGLIFGSFANVVIWRMPRGMRITHPPSACTACGYRLLAADLVPVVSWLALRGHCRRCGIRISVRYPLVELACAVAVTLMVYFYPSFSAVPLGFLAFLLLCVSIIDADGMEIPPALLCAGAVVGIAWVSATFLWPERLPDAPVWHHALLGAAAGFVPLAVCKKFRHAQLCAVIGLFLGWQSMLLALLIAFASLFIVRVTKRRWVPITPHIFASVLFALWI
ncbi:MAG: prepilin peptidase [Defluviitaleaceae bacterium]|nr:prepilin peptidase [Defluviitaleaceae bacterium]